MNTDRKQDKWMVMIDEISLLKNCMYGGTLIYKIGGFEEIIMHIIQCILKKWQEKSFCAIKEYQSG